MNEKIRLGKPKKRRIVWGFNPSPKVVPDKRKKLKDKRRMKELLNEY